MTRPFLAALRIAGIVLGVIVLVAWLAAITQATQARHAIGYAERIHHHRKGNHDCSRPGQHNHREGRICSCRRERLPGATSGRSAFSSRVCLGVGRRGATPRRGPESGGLASGADLTTEHADPGASWLAPPSAPIHTPEAITTQVGVTRTPRVVTSCAHDIATCHRFVVARFDIALIAGARVRVNAPVCDSTPWSCPEGGDRWMDTPLYEVQGMGPQGPFTALTLDPAIPPELPQEAECQDEVEKLAAEGKPAAGKLHECASQATPDWKRISAAAVSSMTVQGQCLGSYVVCVEPTEGLTL